MLSSEERLKKLAEYGISDNDIIVCTIPEYERIKTDPNYRFKKIILDIADDDYQKLLIDKFNNPEGRTYKKIINDFNNGYTEFISFLGGSQMGKSSANLTFSIWRNGTFKFEDNIFYDLTKFLNKLKTSMKSYITLEEAERFLRSFSSSQQQEISNIILDFYETIPFLQNSIAITQPSLRLLTRLKPKLNFVFNFFRRGVAQIYSVQTNIHNERVYFKNTKEYFMSLPLSINLYSKYEQFNYPLKKTLLDEDISKIHQLTNRFQPNPFL